MTREDKRLKETALPKEKVTVTLGISLQKDLLDMQRRNLNLQQQLAAEISTLQQETKDNEAADAATLTRQNTTHAEDPKEYDAQANPSREEFISPHTAEATRRAQAYLNDRAAITQKIADKEKEMNESGNDLAD